MIEPIQVHIAALGGISLSQCHGMIPRKFVDPSLKDANPSSSFDDKYGFVIDQIRIAALPETVISLYRVI